MINRVQNYAWYSAEKSCLGEFEFIKYQQSLLTDIEGLRRLFRQKIELLFGCRTAKRRSEIFISVVQLGSDVVKCYVFITVSLQNMNIQ